AVGEVVRVRESLHGEEPALRRVRFEPLAVGVRADVPQRIAGRAQRGHVVDDERVEAQRAQRQVRARQHRGWWGAGHWSPPAAACTASSATVDSDSCAWAYCFAAAWSRSAVNASMTAVASALVSSLREATSRPMTCPT